MVNHLDPHLDESDAAQEAVEVQVFSPIDIALAHMTREQREEMEDRLTELELRRERLAA